MKKVIILVSCMMMLVINVSAQTQDPTEYESGKVWVRIIDGACIPNEEGATENPILNEILQAFEVGNINRPFWFARTVALQQYYEFNTQGDEIELFNSLQEFNRDGQFFASVELVPVPKTLSDPADWMWYLMNDSDPNNDWLWSLDNIDAPQAWDITKGSPSVKVAVIDNGLDLTHPDLVGKVSPTVDFYTGNAIAPLSHGTSVATILAAETVDAGQPSNGQMASIGYNTQIMFASSSVGLQASVYASTVEGVDVISISWYTSCSSYPAALLAEQEILDNGTTIVRGAGNGPDFCNGGRLYPFSGLEDDRTIVVTSVGKDDRHVNTHSCTNFSTNSHYAQVDVSAPGYELMGGIPVSEFPAWPYYGCWGGTSQSTPIVSGTAALMYSVNGCLSSNWTQDILRYTADPITDAQNFPGAVGTGRINAHKAVLAAQGAYSQDLDLYMKDRPEDFGYAGSYAWGWWFDHSPDIWVRNQADGYTNFEHEDPEYSANHPVYVYVRVWNKSCVPSNGEGELSLYWSKASSASGWPQNWDGTDPNVGDLIGSQSIPNIPPGESIILEFEWEIINPYIHANWASCLLARIENLSGDPITVYPMHLEYDVFNNNNIALHNVTIIDISPLSHLPVINDEPFPHGRYMFIGNPTDEANTFDIEIKATPNSDQDYIPEKAEVTITFDENAWEYIESAALGNPDFEIIGEYRLLMKKNTAVLQGIEIPADVRFPIYVGFNFLVESAEDEASYEIHVSQWESGRGNLFGAEHFLVQKEQRQQFEADAGPDQQVHKNQSIELLAEDIGEDAIYNWYNSSGTLIYTGTSCPLNPTLTADYKLEVIATSDGTKDYDIVNVEVLTSWIESLSPNPADNQLTIGYEVDGSASVASVSIVDGNGTTLKSYSLDLHYDTINCNVSDLKPGVYHVVLIVGNKTMDSRSLIVE